MDVAGFRPATLPASTAAKTPSSSFQFGTSLRLPFHGLFFRPSLCLVSKRLLGTWVMGLSARLVSFEEAEARKLDLPPSALAVVASIRAMQPSPDISFSQKLSKNGDGGLFSGPSLEFLEYCREHFSLMYDIMDHKVLFTVYVRSPESYQTGQLEFQCVSMPYGDRGRNDYYTENNTLVFHSSNRGSLHGVEVALAQREMIELPEFRALVVPMAKDLCLVGLLVAEQIEVGDPLGSNGKDLCLNSGVDYGDSNVQGAYLLDTLVDVQRPAKPIFSTQELRQIIGIAHSLSLTCIMDQRVALLHQTSWQRTVQIDNLLEQARGPITVIRTLARMLLPQLKRGEIPRDVVQDMLVQGDRMKEFLQQMQEVLYFRTGASRDVQYDSAVNGIHDIPKDFRGQPKTAWLLNNTRQGRDEELPMPPAALASPVLHGASCNVTEVLSELIEAGVGVAHQRHQRLQLLKNARESRLMAAIDENALRQALSKLLDSSMQRTPRGGWIRTEARSAPGGGVLVIIEDNGPDMSFLMQARALGALGSGLKTFTWDGNDESAALKFGLDIKIARDILEKFGGVMRMTSPYLIETPLGAGGIRLEIWLPVTASNNELEIVLHPSRA